MINNNPNCCLFFYHNNAQLLILSDHLILWYLRKDDVPQSVSVNFIEMNKAILLILFVAGLSQVEPHGYVLSPLSRTSIFRNRDQNGAQVPFWWNDTGVWCGNVQQNLQYSTCGRCGDDPGNTHANQGGRYDKGIITGTYTAGQVRSVKYLHLRSTLYSCHLYVMN